MTFVIYIFYFICYLYIFIIDFALSWTDGVIAWKIRHLFYDYDIQNFTDCNRDSSKNSEKNWECCTTRKLRNVKSKWFQINKRDFLCWRESIPDNVSFCLWPHTTNLEVQLPIEKWLFCNFRWFSKPRGGTPIWNRRVCSSEILNLTPKGDQSGCGLSKFWPLKETA